MYSDSLQEDCSVSSFESQSASTSDELSRGSEFTDCETGASSPPRTPTLRKRKPIKHNASRPLDDITEREMNMTSLSSYSCRVINCKFRQSLVGRGHGYSDIQPFMVASEGFHVKTGNVDLYAGELMVRNVDTSPGALCPCPKKHVEIMALYGHELPLACPTCWSVQRN